MILAIDIGNSNVVIGCLDENNRVVAQFRMVTDLKKTEDAIAACEARQTEIAEELSNEAVCADYEQAQKLTEEAAQLDERLLNLYDEWEKLSEELEKG